MTASPELIADELPQKPLFSVIMPVRNEVATLVRALGAVLDQRYPRERMEVLVIDAGSHDGSYELLRRATYDRRVRLLENPHGSDEAAFALGLAQARGALIVPLDARTVVAPGFLAACEQALAQSGAEVVMGEIRFAGTTTWGRAAALAAAAPLGTTNPFTAVYRRAAFDPQMPNLPTATGFFAPAVVATQYGPETPGALWRQQFRAGGRAGAQLRSQPLAAPTRLVPAGLALLLGASGIVAPFWRRVRRIWLALVAMYAVLLAVATLIAGSNAERAGERRQWRAGSLGPLDGGAPSSSLKRAGNVWLRLPAVLACSHLAYGCGIVAGTLNAER